MSFQRCESAGLTPDAWLLVFQELVGDYESLCSVGLTCQSWRSLSLPCLLQIVDIISHNNGRLPEHESDTTPVVYADFGGEYRPQNLICRQRAFLRLISTRPDLAKCVRSFTWTLIWLDFEESNLQEIDRQTWNVFSRMINVVHLDLASLHEVGEDNFVRQNPSLLFPAITSLRLLGWMHRGLVQAIITSLDATKLRILKLDFLQDEGALIDGSAIDFHEVENYAHTAKKAATSGPIGEDLFRRQESGQACIFPGPMWLPLHLLSSRLLGSLTHLRVDLASFSMRLDLRSYYTLFRDTARFILQSRESLTDLRLIFRQHPGVYEQHRKKGQCGTAYNFQRFTYRPWCIRMAVEFTNAVVPVLSQTAFPRLRNVTLEGFNILTSASSEEATRLGLGIPLQRIRDCPYIDGFILEAIKLDHRKEFIGHDCITPYMSGLTDTLRNS